MKKIIQQYGADLEWINHHAKQFGGKVEGNHIKVSKTIHTGTRYFLDCGAGIVTLFIDAVYQTDLQIIQKNKKKDFIGLYYNLSESEAQLSFNAGPKTIGKWAYNLSLIDGSLNCQFEVKKGSEISLFCIFIKKDLIRHYAQKNKLFKTRIDEMLDPKLNTFVKWDRMSPKSYQAIKDLQKLEVGGVLFDLHVKGTTHLLIADYLKKVTSEKFIIQHVNGDDLATILIVQRYLLDNIDSPFPGINFMAQKCNMSKTKFKKLFKKITGDNPSSFFMDNKLLKAKELLSKNDLSVAEITKKLNFGTTTYFALRFKTKFGILPYKFKKQL